MGVAVTLTEAAALLGLSPTTLRSQIRHGALRATKKGRDWHVTPGEVERYRIESLGRRRRLSLEADTIRATLHATEPPERVAGDGSRLYARQAPRQARDPETTA